MDPFDRLIASQSTLEGIVPKEGRTRDGGWRSVPLYEGADDLAWDGRNHCALWADGRVACLRPDAGSWKQD